ncbi:MAG: ABC transporter substrate-binding protein [Treponema sp.]|nr:ABC transporter substrate-binding protein [Treponema sp.]
MKRTVTMTSLLLILGVSLAFAGGGQQSGSQQGGGTTASGDLAYKGTITIYSNAAYNPTEPTQSNPNPATKLREVAAKYEALHPGIKIEFLPSLDDTQNFTVWIRTKISGGQAPDIFWAQYFELNSGLIPAGSFYKLNEYFERPNKYVSGNTRWLDLFNPGLLDQQRNSDGSLYNVDCDYVGTQVMYNKELFQKAGINFEINTWSEYTRACDMLKAAGITPWGFWFGTDYSSMDNVAWFARLFGTNLYYNDWDNLAVISGRNTVALSPLEVAIGVKNGYFTPEDPRWISWWGVIKEHLDKYMPRDSISPAVTPRTIFNMFVNQQVAMFWGGTWVPTDMRNANVSFEYSSFPFPYPDKPSFPQATSFNSSGAVGGPSSAWQYAISTPRANTTMTPAKLEACLDWLMFASAPENVELVVNEIGNSVPTIKGTKPTAANAAIAKILETELKLIDTGLLSMGSEFVDVYYREYQTYLQGNQTLQQAGAKIVPVLNRMADDIIAKSGVDITPYLKKK